MQAPTPPRLGLGLLMAAVFANCAMGFNAPALLGTTIFTSRSKAISPSLRSSLIGKPSASGLKMSLETGHPPLVNMGFPLPIVYVYDHCPFCVRARAIFGIKNIKHEVRFMANDDVDTPTALVGKKIAPILSIPQKNEVMMESLDIVKRIDEDPSMGSPVLKPATGRSDLKAWEKTHQETFRLLQRPRYVNSGLLPEFATKSGRNAFVKNHPIGPYEKAEWKDDSKFSMDQRYAKYKEAMEQSAELIPKANTAVAELESMIYSAKHCSEGGLGYDDIELFGRLRSLTIIKGLEMGPKLRGYLEYMSSKTDIPLYFQMAC